MRLVAEPRCRSGEVWRCRVRDREANRRYSHSTKGREVQRLAHRRYIDTPKGRETKRRIERNFDQTPHGKTEALRCTRIRRARKHGVESDGHTREEVWERDGGKCQMCGKKLRKDNWHEDHIVPLSKGGSDLLENVQATCPPCNLHKSAKLVAA